MKIKTIRRLDVGSHPKKSSFSRGKPKKYLLFL